MKMYIRCKWALTCFEKNNLVILTKIHESSDALGELYHILDGVGDVDGTLLPHDLCRLKREARGLSKVGMSPDIHTYTYYYNVPLYNLRLLAMSSKLCIHTF